LAASTWQVRAPAAQDRELGGAGPLHALAEVPRRLSDCPHWHLAVERVTVISGTFPLGMGETFDQAKARALPAGAFMFMAPQIAHFAWMQGDTIVQLTGEGPWGITYLNPAAEEIGAIGRPAQTHGTA
jgi:hypothetical protein